MEAPEVRVGQVWADNDKRNRARRYIQITAIDGDKAVCEAWYDEPSSKARTVRIRLDRFKPTSTGYQLVSEPDGGA
jgi:hypothetical protein